MDKKIIISIIISVLAILGIGIWFATQAEKPILTGLDDFAKCLTEKKVVMYGAAWCPHCQNEKKAFGDSFKYVTYVECPVETKRCLDEGINGYPTWTFSDGSRVEGEMGVKRLSEKTQCALPEK